jgi:hypothetical protein
MNVLCKRTIAFSIPIPIGLFILWCSGWNGERCANLVGALVCSLFLSCLFAAFPFSDR